MKTPLGARRGLALLALVALWTPARARGGESPSDTAVVSIEGITVTGSRIPEHLLRSPSAVSLVSRERFRSGRQISLADGLSHVPGVLTQSRGGAQDVRITIRGYGARGNGERSNAGNMRGIRVLTDGIPLTEPDGRTSLDFVDLGGAERIEVMRSNGSVLYGNASGGVVNLRSSQEFDRPFVEFKSRAGSFGFHREQGVLGYAFGRSRGTLSVYSSAFDGWRAHSASATTSVQNRLSTPLDDRTRLGALLDFASNFNRFPGALTLDRLAATPQAANPTFVTRDERRFHRVGRLGVTLDRELAGSQHLALASWVEPKVLQRSERNRFRDFTRYHVGGNATWQLERALSPDWQSRWTVGGDEQYQDGAIQFYDLNPDGSRGTSLLANKREGANSAGAFAQGELRWREQWALRLAARYDNLWYISEDRQAPELNASRHFTQVTPKGSIARFFGRHTAYLSIGGGLEAPAFNEIDPPAPYDTLTSLNPFLDPMRSVSYELGGRGTVGSGEGRLGRLDYDAALYWIEVTNDIVPFNGGAYFYTAGKSRRRGAELGLDWTPLARLTLGGSWTLSHNEYVSYRNDLGDFAGKDVAGLPALFFDAEARWHVIGGLSLGGRFRHVGRYFANDSNTAAARAAGVVGAEAEYSRAASFGVWRAFVAGDNLTDEDYVGSVFINGINGQFYEPGLPRNFTAGVSLTLRRAPRRAGRRRPARGRPGGGCPVVRDPLPDSEIPSTLGGAPPGLA